MNSNGKLVHKPFLDLGVWLNEKTGLVDTSRNALPRTIIQCQELGELLDY
jgi:hypothetical protein